MQTILIVDDEFSLVETLAEILSWEGYGIATAANGRLALLELERQIPSLILVDFMMPVMDGIQLIEALRNDAKHRHIPIVMMTAAMMALPTEKRRYDALLRKPFDIDTVLSVVRRFLPAAEQSEPKR